MRSFQSSRIMKSLYCLLLLSCLSGVSLGTTTSSQTQTSTQQRQRYAQNYALEIPYANMTSNFREWETDMAIMFYAPWCKFCKQLYPSWEQIAMAMSASTKELTVGKFNCEAPAKNVEICQHLGVDRYPSVYYIGYGAMNQAPKSGNPFGRNPQPRVARFTADLYPEAIFDWVRMLTQISSWQRKWDDFKGIFTGRTRSAMKVISLQKKVSDLKDKVSLFGKSLERYKADELFDSLADYGDPFPVMSALEPDEQNLPLRICVGDMSTEYCKYHYDEEAFCIKLAKCMELEMEPQTCRPEVCPFLARGCKVASACMQKSVLDEYKKEFAKTSTTTNTATVGASTGAAATAASTPGFKTQADVGYNGNQRVAA